MKEVAPIGREIGAVEQTWHHLEIANLQHVTGAGVLDEDRPRHDVDAGIAVGLGHIEIELPNALVHEELRRITGMMRHRLDAYEVTALDAQCGRETAVEIAPVDGFAIGGKNVEHMRGSLLREMRLTSARP